MTGTRRTRTLTFVFVLLPKTKKKYKVSLCRYAHPRVTSMSSKIIARCHLSLLKLKYVWIVRNNCAASQTPTPSSEWIVSIRPNVMVTPILILYFRPTFLFLPAHSNFTRGELKIGRSLERTSPSSLPAVSNAPAHCYDA